MAKTWRREDRIGLSDSGIESSGPDLLLPAFTKPIDGVNVLFHESEMIQTQGLTHIHLMVRDLERSLRFYQDVFGMKELFREGAAMVFLNTPGSRDSITLNEDPAMSGVAGQSGGVAHIGFRLTNKSDLDAAIAEIERAGGRVLSRGEHAPGIRYAYVADPDGYVIEI